MKSAKKSIYNFDVQSISGEVCKLSNFEGRVLLIVNVASNCGFTPQYSDLQKLYEKYSEQGLSILAFPCNDFGAQEPNNDEKIKGFCQTNFNVTFNLFSKVTLLGPQKLDLYQYLYDCGLKHQGGGGWRSRIFGLVKSILYRIKGKYAPSKNEAQWNFHKFLVGKNGIPVASFLSEVAPNSSILTFQLEEELKK
ncbi:MAG: glutathione peroxidase [Nitrospinaceae bacterium]|jgi:glutathione peroxidase